jgi:hypothetical protein
LQKCFQLEHRQGHRPFEGLSPVPSKRQKCGHQEEDAEHQNNDRQETCDCYKLETPDFERSSTAGRVANDASTLTGNNPRGETENCLNRDVSSVECRHLSPTSALSSLPCSLPILNSVHERTLDGDCGAASEVSSFPGHLTLGSRLDYMTSASSDMPTFASSNRKSLTALPVSQSLAGDSSSFLASDPREPTLRPSGSPRYRDGSATPTPAGFSQEMTSAEGSSTQVMSLGFTREVTSSRFPAAEMLSSESCPGTRCCCCSEEDMDDGYICDCDCCCCQCLQELKVTPDEVMLWKTQLAAIRIQHAYRGHYMRKRQAAALKIQKFMRESRQKLQKARCLV